MVEIIEVLAKSESTKKALLREIPTVKTIWGKENPSPVFFEDVSAFFVSGKWDDDALRRVLQTHTKLENWVLYDSIGSILFLKNR